MTIEEQLEQTKQQLQTVQEQLSQFKDIDPSKARDAIAQVGSLQQQNQQLSAQVSQLQESKQTLQDQLGAKDLHLSAVEAVYQAGVLPEYRDLLLPRVQESLTATDKGVLGPNGSNPVDYVRSLSDNYKALFAPPANPGGTGAGSGQVPSQSSAKVVEAQNGLITGADPEAVIKGDTLIR